MSSTDLNDVMAEVQEASQNGQQRFVERLLERVGAGASARAVFGEPVERDGVTIIPAARVAWGAGGGGGAGTTSKGEKSDVGEGGGGGGGVNARPFGYIEIRDGQARFVQFRDPASFVPLVMAVGFGSWLLLRGLRALVR
ncbi:MAG: hypothetical protein IT304_01660 [Dehalococcoidia bacterium]|nr:hypothetical protein [Dehalococcoidia bacterium]